MNQTDDRARCYGQRDVLALRMIQHGARSSAVSTWTALSIDRVYTLAQRDASVPQAPHRGRSPRRIAYFFCTPLIAIHAATLASLFNLFEIPSETTLGTPTQSFRTLDPGEKLCCAYEMYIAMVESPLIRFEHAVLLATALAEGREIFLRYCPKCGRARLVDWSGFARDTCMHCPPDAHWASIAGSPA